MNRRNVTEMMALALMTLVTGCQYDDGYPNNRKVDEMARTESAERHLIAGAHGDDMAQQHAAMHPEAVEEIKLFRNEFNARMVAAEAGTEKRISESSEKTASNLQRLAKEVDDVVLTVIGKDKEDALRDATIANMGGEIRDVESDLEKLGDRLTTETKQTLAGMATETLVNLKNAESRAEVNQILQEQAGLTEKQVAEFDGMTQQQIVAVIIGLMMAAGGGAGASRFGKSRSQGATDATDAKLETLKTEVANFKTTVAAGLDTTKATAPPL